MSGPAPVNPELTTDLARRVADQEARIRLLERQLADLRRTLGK
jgi:hypothetical protein